MKNAITLNNSEANIAVNSLDFFITYLSGSLRLLNSFPQRFWDLQLSLEKAMKMELVLQDLQVKYMAYSPDAQIAVRLKYLILQGTCNMSGPVSRLGLSTTEKEIFLRGLSLFNSLVTNGLSHLPEFMKRDFSGQITEAEKIEVQDSCNQIMEMIFSPDNFLSPSAKDDMSTLQLLIDRTN